MTDQLAQIVNGAIVATQAYLLQGPIKAAKVLLVTPTGLLARDCFLDLTNPAHRKPALSELRILARITRAHVAVIMVPLLDSIVFYVECKDSAAWQGQCPVKGGTLLPFTFGDGKGSHFNPVLSLNTGVPIVDTDAG